MVRPRNSEDGRSLTARQRCVVAVCSATWTVVGGVIAVSGMPSATGTGLPFLVGATVVALIAGLGATLAVSRGRPVLGALMLLLSCLYPTYFFAVIDAFPVLLAGYLLVSRSNHRGMRPTATATTTTTTTR